ASVNPATIFRSNEFFTLAPLQSRADAHWTIPRRAEGASQKKPRPGSVPHGVFTSLLARMEGPPQIGSLIKLASDSGSSPSAAGSSDCGLRFWASRGAFA